MEGRLVAQFNGSLLTEDFKMKWKTLALATLILGPGSLWANDIVIKVDGMVCAFCSQGLTKAFNKEDAVEKVDVDLTKKTVSLKTKTGKDLTDGHIGEIIEDAGFKLRGIERTK